MNELKARDYFIQMASALISVNGFNLETQDSGMDFVKRSKQGYIKIQLLPAYYGGHSEFGLSFFIRSDEINSVVNKFNNTVGTAQATNPTFGISIGHFSISNENLIVDSQDQMIRGVNMLIDLLEKKAIPLLESLQSIDAIDNEFNRENRPQNLFLNDAFDRPIVGITAAALNHSPRFSFWEEYYRNRLTNASKGRKDKFDELIKNLKTRV